MSGSSRKEKHKKKKKEVVVVETFRDIPELEVINASGIDEKLMEQKLDLLVTALDFIKPNKMRFKLSENAEKTMAESAEKIADLRSRTGTTFGGQGGKAVGFNDAEENFEVVDVKKNLVPDTKEMAKKVFDKVIDFCKNC
jgi:hypothetical protein